MKRLGVLAAGLAAITGAVDILLVSVDNDIYGYMMAIVWNFFVTVYYLSLLPRFNSEDPSDQAYTREVCYYPRFLEILVSYIAVPLVGAYTLVLLAYFVKIAVNQSMAYRPAESDDPGVFLCRAYYLCFSQLPGKLLRCPVPAPFPESVDSRSGYAAYFSIYTA